MKYLLSLKDTKYKIKYQTWITSLFNFVGITVQTFFNMLLIIQLSINEIFNNRILKKFFDLKYILFIILKY